MVQYLITAIIDLLVGLQALTKTRNKSSLAFTATAICFGLWSLELFLLTSLQNFKVLEITFHLTRTGMFFIPPALALLTWRLTGGKSKKFLYIVLVPAFLVSTAVSIANNTFLPSSLKQAENGYLPEVDSIFYVFALTFVWCLVGSCILGIVSYGPAPGREKRRLKWLLITLIIACLFGLTSIFLVRYDFYLSKLVGAVTNIVFVTLLMHLTVQHHLMDMKFAVSSSIARAGLLVLFVSLFLMLENWISSFNDNSGKVLITIIFFVVALEAYPRLLRQVLPNTKKLIESTSYDYDLVITELSEALQRCGSYADLNSVLQHFLCKIAQITHVNILIDFKITSVEDRFLEFCNEQDTLVIFDETPEEIRDQLSEYQAFAGCSVRQGEETLAVLFFGPSTVSSYYRYDDIRLFEWLRQHLSQVVSKVNTLENLSHDLLDAKKTLSMLSIMNQYHHDIKAPLSIIDGVLSNDIYDQERQREIILEQVERGSRLITMMAGILSGERKRKEEKLDIETLVKDSLQIFEHKIPDKIVNFSSQPKYIYGDDNDLKILFINLIKNAIEASHPDRILSISVNSWIGQEGKIYVNLEDNGMGMPSERANAIWELDSSSKTGGNAIGLKAIKRIADEHHAEVKVRSEEQLGTTFTLSFPAAV